MRKVKYLQNYDGHKKGDIVSMDRDQANRVMIAQIVTYYIKG